jgi:hypothetical protein
VATVCGDDATAKIVGGVYAVIFPCLYLLSAEVVAAHNRYLSTIIVSFVGELARRAHPYRFDPDFFSLCPRRCPAWPEEVARYLMVWMAMLCAPLAYHQGEHAAITFLLESLAPKRKRWWQAAIDLTVAGTSPTAKERTAFVRAAEPTIKWYVARYGSFWVRRLQAAIRQQAVMHR